MFLFLENPDISSFYSEWKERKKNERHFARKMLVEFSWQSNILMMINNIITLWMAVNNDDGMGMGYGNGCSPLSCIHCPRPDWCRLRNGQERPFALLRFVSWIQIGHLTKYVLMDGIIFISFLNKILFYSILLNSIQFYSILLDFSCWIWKQLPFLEINLRLPFIN